MEKNKKAFEHFPNLEKAFNEVQARGEKQAASRKTKNTLSSATQEFRVRWERRFRTDFPEIPFSPISPTRDIPRIKRQVVVPLRDAGYWTGDFVDFLFDQWSMFPYFEEFKTFKHHLTAPSLNWVLKFSEAYIMAFTNHVEGRSVRRVRRKDEKAGTDTESKHMVPKSALTTLATKAEKEIAKRDAEIARLRAETRRLQSKVKRRITKPSTAKPNDDTPEWE